MIDIDTLLAEVAPLAKMDRDAAAESAPEFRALSFFESHEPISTKILSYLLNPCAPHGRGCTFLETFLDALSIDIGVKKLQSVVVQPNAPCYTKNRRWPRQLDLLILFRSAETEYAVAIESKSHDAEDQESQVQDYLDHVQRKYPGRRLFFYYLKRGMPPKNKSIGRDKWEQAEKSGICRALSYSSTISNWLDLSLKKCGAGKVRFFLEDFRIFLGLTETGGRHMNATEKIREILRTEADGLEQRSADSEKLEALLAIYDSHDEIWNTAIHLFMNQVIGKLKAELTGWNTQYDSADGHELGIFPPGVNPAKPTIGMYLSPEPDPGTGREKPSTCFALYIVADHADLWPNLKFGPKPNDHLLRLGERQTDLWARTRPVGVADIKSADGIRSLLTAQAAHEVATTFASFATDQWADIQQASDQATSSR